MVFEKLPLKDSLHFIVFAKKANEENWQNVLININFWEYLTNILWINLYFIL